MVIGPVGSTIPMQQQPVIGSQPPVNQPYSTGYNYNPNPNLNPNPNSTLPPL